MVLAISMLLADAVSASGGHALVSIPLVSISNGRSDQDPLISCFFLVSAPAGLAGALETLAPPTMVRMPGYLRARSRLSLGVTMIVICMHDSGAQQPLDCTFYDSFMTIVLRQDNYNRCLRFLCKYFDVFLSSATHKTILDLGLIAYGCLGVPA
jgi:hypothetical protein